MKIVWAQLQCIWEKGQKPPWKWNRISWFLLPSYEMRKGESKRDESIFFLLNRMKWVFGFKEISWKWTIMQDYHWSQRALSWIHTQISLGRSWSSLFYVAIAFLWGFLWVSWEVGQGLDEVWSYILTKWEEKHLWKLSLQRKRQRIQSEGRDQSAHCCSQCVSGNHPCSWPTFLRKHINRLREALWWAWVMSLVDNTSVESPLSGVLPLAFVKASPSISKLDWRLLWLQ